MLKALGWSVSISGNGSRVAEADGEGNVKIYEWDGVSWVQLGQDLNGIGTSVSINDNGSAIALGGTLGQDFNGIVRIYAWNGTTWVQQGQDINGEAQYDEFGTSVSINSIGNRVAIGAPGNDDNLKQLAM